MKLRYAFVAFVAALGSLPTLADQLTVNLWSQFANMYGHIDQNTPGIINGPDACGPTATVNSLIYLQNRYGMTGLVPTLDRNNPSNDLDGDTDVDDVDDAIAAINQMGVDMSLDSNGVIDPKFVSGKTQYLMDGGFYFGPGDPRNKLEIEWQADNVPSDAAHPGGTQTKPTAQFVYEQLLRGQDVEVGFSWFNPGTTANPNDPNDPNSYSGAGGHWVTGTSIDWNTVTNTGLLDFFDPWGAVHIVGNLSLLNDGHLVLEYTSGAAGIGDNEFHEARAMIDIVVAESPVPLPASVWMGATLLIGLMGTSALRRRRALVQV